MTETVIYWRKSASESSEITAFVSYWIANAATNQRFEYVWKVRINAETRILDWEGAIGNDLAHPASFMVTLVVWRPPNQHFKDHLRWITILIVSILAVCLLCIYSSHVYHRYPVITELKANYRWKSTTNISMVNTSLVYSIEGQRSSQRRCLHCRWIEK